jgi:formylglycine-generating enzyme required for sulfatase activity
VGRHAALNRRRRFSESPRGVPPRRLRRDARFARLACVFAFLCGCAPLPYGETLVVVDTDVAVPRLLDHLRVDVYGDTGTWLESRHFFADRPEAWPLSFALATEAGTDRVARVRLRGFLSGRSRDYRGEQSPDVSFDEPKVASDLSSLCATAPLVPPDTDYRARRGADPITSHIKQGDCTHTSEAGSLAVRIQIATADTYRFEVVRSDPDASLGLPNGDTVLFLRSDCNDVNTQLACHDNLDANNLLSRIVMPLQPGSYYLMTTGGFALSPADVTLRWGRASTWDPTGLTPSPPAIPTTPGLPRLVHDGVDVTPADEPQPGVTIERVVDVEVRGGTRRSAQVLLSGECFGTTADWSGGSACVDRPGERSAIGKIATSDGLERPRSRIGSWARLASDPCGEPRADSGAHDDEVCIPGGVFVFGSSSVLTPKGRDGFPEQVAAIPSFLMDRHEVTVARYRQALRAGFGGVDPISPMANNLPLHSTPNLGTFCTWNGDENGPAGTLQRESHPLNCMSWYEARALCQFYGGDLPSEAEWEYAASAAGRDGEATYPWGEEPPTCDHARHLGNTGLACAGGPLGPRPVDSEPWATRGQSALGLVGMGGNLAEWTLDSGRPLSDPCFAQRKLLDVGCRETEAPQRVVRGGKWSGSADTLRAASRDFAAPGPAGPFGFRCIRRIAP